MAFFNWVSSLFPDNFLSLPAIAKVTAFFLAWAGVWLPVAIPLAIALKWQPLQPLTLRQKLPLLASLYCLAPGVLWGALQFEGESWSSYGLFWNSALLRSFGLGFGVGILGLMILFGIERLCGWVSWQPFPHTSSKSEADPFASIQQWGAVLLPTLFLALWISGTEELIFRGFLQNQLQQDYAPWLAAAIASAIFAVLHLVWEGWEASPQLPGLWLMGMVLVLSRWADGGSLGLAWGLHAGWVWVIASLDASQALLYRDRCPTWITGLNHHPLAGVMGLGFLLSTGITLWYLF